MNRTLTLLLSAACLGSAAAAGLAAAESGAFPRSTPARAAAGFRAILPDPALLDGSAHAPEKRSALGMVGDFELPGDEKARSEKVGASALPSGQPEPETAGEGGGSVPGKGGDRSGPEASKPGGMAPAVPPAGSGDQAQGIQVAELKGDAPAASTESKAPGRPSAMAIGDQAMRIPQQPGKSGVVGTQQVANVNTQDYEKGTGTGGKGPVNKGGPNRTEKGRVIPSGL